MNKKETELLQAFSDLEKKIAEMRVAIRCVGSLAPQKSSYFESWFKPIETQLAQFKTKFYNILLEVEEPND